MSTIKISIYILFVIAAGLLDLKFTSGDTSKAEGSSYESENGTDTAAPAVMTTQEPIDIDSLPEEVTCTSHNNCEDCYLFNCTWVQCLNRESSCLDSPFESCPKIPCEGPDPNTTTTTEAPDTTTTNATTAPTTTTTEPANDTTTVPPTTTDKPTDPTTPLPTTTPSSNSSTVTPTSSPAPDPTAPPAPHDQRHFDAASFVGGMILAVALTGLSFAGWKYYRTRSLATSYSNLTESIHM